MDAQISEMDGVEGPEAQGLVTRLCALSMLEDVTQRKQPLDQVFENNQQFKALTIRDRSFVKMLVTTALRRCGQVDHLISKAVEKESPKNPTLHNILRLGITQICFMNVPDHAAVDLSVRLAEESRLDRQKGFVNGVLRNITRSGREWVERQDAGRLNTPEWLLKAWIEDYGMAVAAQITEAHMAEAPLDITIKDENSRNYWASHFKATELTTGSLRIPTGGNVAEFDGFSDGAWWVQDASSAIPVRVMGEITGQTVLDLCAAPGGKTMQMAAKGASVVSLDRSANRLKRLSENLERVGLSDKVEVITADASSWRPQAPAPYILLDAPCSATGTARRHPDLYQLKTEQDVERLVSIQAKMLENAFEMLMPGGVLVYCTCSLQKIEGEAQVEALLARHEAAQRLPIVKAELGGFDEAITPDGDLRILPFHQAALGGMDGFYIARITKSA